MSLRDISNLSFKKGTLGPDKRDEENLFISLFRRALNYFGITYPNSGAPGKTDVIIDVADFSSYSPTVSTSSIFVSDPIRGGQFYLYTGGSSADNGMIFEDADGNKWKRAIYDTRVSVVWYGASPDNPDNYDQFISTRDYIFAHTSEVNTIYIPAGAYYLSQTLTITQSIIIRGDSFYTSPTTRLIFPFNTTGIFIDVISYVYSAEIHSISVENQNGGLLRDITPLIDVRAKIYFTDVYIPYASGIGINLEACLNSPDQPDFGACDYSSLFGCKITFAIHGFRIQGCDANYISFYDCEAGQNLRWGFYDNSLLGCNFFGCRTEANSNASLPGAATTVTYSGLYYTSTMLGDDDNSNINKQPDISPTYWTAVGAQAATAWNDSTTYYSGGSRVSLHPSGTSQWYGPYDEGDQQPSILNSRSMQYGGLRGAGTSAGTIYRDQGSFQLTSNTNLQGYVNVGSPSPEFQYPFQVKANNEESVVATFQSDAVGALIALNTISGTDGGFMWVQGGILYHGTTGVRTALSVGSFADADANGVIDLGGPSNKWKGVYATTARITGLSEYADNAAAISAGKSVGDFYRTVDTLKVVH